MLGHQWSVVTGQSVCCDAPMAGLPVVSDSGPYILEAPNRSPGRPLCPGCTSTTYVLYQINLCIIFSTNLWFDGNDYCHNTSTAKLTFIDRYSFLRVLCATQRPTPNVGHVIPFVDSVVSLCTYYRRHSIFLVGHHREPPTHLELSPIRTINTRVINRGPAPTIQRRLRGLFRYVRPNPSSAA